jgi:cysteine desulfurase
VGKFSEEPLYLDFAASTPPAQEVIEAMMPWLRGAHANPHSDHWHGRRAAQAVEAAREAVADLLGGQPEGVTFTSGATEANNLALKGMLSAVGARRHLWIADIEHKSLLEPARHLATTGIAVHKIAVSVTGLIDATGLQADLQRRGQSPGLVAVSHGNNEIGTLQPLPELGRIAHAAGHLLHVDASQSAARVPISVEDDGCDLLCLSSHKLYGPAGIGALYLAPDLLQDLQPLLHGGGQEGGRRSGTVPPFLAVGFGTAAALAKRNLAEDQRHVVQIVEAFLNRLEEHGIAFALIGHPERRLPGHLSLRFEGVDSEDMISILAPSLSASTGAACAAGELRASRVLRAIGLDEQAASEVVRISFGRESSLAQASRAAQLVAEAVRRIRGRSDGESLGLGHSIPGAHA